MNLHLLFLAFDSKMNNAIKKLEMKSKKYGSVFLLSALLLSFQLSFAQPVSTIMMKPMKIVYVTDTAVGRESISQKMQKGYSTLFGFIIQQRLISSRTLAIYQTMTSPWVFEIAVEVDKEPQQLTNGVQFKTIEGGEAIVIHYKGPYEGIEKAYLQMEQWLKKNKKQKVGPVIEAYLNDPGTVKDKNELLTDIYQLIK
jgi:effector-binding domain-containing protein